VKRSCPSTTGGFADCAHPNGTGRNDALANSPDIMKKQADFEADWMDLLISYKDKVKYFDMDGKYLGEWDHLGQVTAVAFRNGNLWIGTQFSNQSTESDGWHMRIDRKTGKILEYVESGHSHHVLNINKKGELLAGARPDKPWYFVMKK